MSYTLIRSKARNRFSENQIFLNHLTSLEPTDPSISASLELKTMRGLFYVHLYGSLEKTINELIENTLLLIGSNNVQFVHFSIPFNSISLRDRLKSLKDSGYKNFLEKSIELFTEMQSSDVASINETIFSNNLQNIWTATIEEIIKTFGISGFNIAPTVKITINELVEKRNAVAHGRESASTVGERFRTDVLRIKMDIVIAFAYDLIDVFENYYNDKKFLKGYAKKHYTITP